MLVPHTSPFLPTHPPTHAPFLPTHPLFLSAHPPTLPCCPSTDRPSLPATRPYPTLRRPAWEFPLAATLPFFLLTFFIMCWTNGVGASTGE